MKKIISFMLLLAACGTEDDLSNPPPDEVEQVSEVKEEPSEGEGEGETNTHTDTHTRMQENVLNQYSNDMLIRLKACVFIPRCFDANPVTGEQVCAIKWHCPPGFR
jgi:hypothetical protein